MKPKFIGRPLCRTNDGNVLWEFAGNITGIISMNDAEYLCRLGLGLIEPDPGRNKIALLG